MTEARRAVDALTVAPFAQRRLYDVAQNGKRVPFEIKGTTTAARAVLTYPEPDRFVGSPDGFSRLATRSYVYDNALYALWMTNDKQQTKAAAVLETLVALQRPDGAWGFSFDVSKRNFYNVGYVRTGVVAWVVQALASYRAQFGDQRFDSAMHKAVTWLKRQHSDSLQLLRGGLGRWSADSTQFRADYVADWASTEHNIDAYFALRTAQSAGVADTGFQRLADAIAKRLYIRSQRRYAQGLRGERQDMVSALDASGTWSALFEIGRGQPQRASHLVKWVERHHRIEDGGWRGYKPYRKGPEVWFVEGSLALALVNYRLGRVDQARTLTAEVAKLSCAGRRPLLYSTSWAPDFPATPAAAPTLWFALVSNEVDGEQNPFLWVPTP